MCSRLQRVHNVHVAVYTPQDTYICIGRCSHLHQRKPAATPAKPGALGNLPPAATSDSSILYTNPQSMCNRNTHNIPLHEATFSTRGYLCMLMSCVWSSGKDQRQMGHVTCSASHVPMHPTQNSCPQGSCWISTAGAGFAAAAEAALPHLQ